jgi:hypothetical protein
VTEWLITGDVAIQVATSTFSGTGLVHMTGGVLDGPAWPFSLGPSTDQIIVTNHAGTDTAAITAAGDINYASGSFTVVGFQGRAVASTAPSNGYAYVWNSGAGQWQPQSVLTGSGVSGTGLWFSSAGALDTSGVTLTGDVSQGALSGNNLPLEVVGILNHALPALSAGYLEWTGSAWTFGPGGGGATVTWANDLVNSNNSNQYVSSISYSSAAAGGTVVINGTGTAFQIAANNTGFQFYQATQTSSTAPANLTIRPQWQSGSDEGSAAANTPGSLIVNVGSPYTTTNAGTNAGMYLYDGSNPVMRMGMQPGTTTVGLIHFGADAGTGTWAYNNYTFAGSAGNSYLNAPAGGGEVHLQVAATDYLVVSTGAVTPGGDINASLGTSTLRWTSVNAGPGGFKVYHASGDANPSAYLGDLTLSFGPGGTPVDTVFQRVGVAAAQLVSTSNGNATLYIGGSSANELEINSSNTTISVTGTGATTGANLTLQAQAAASNYTPGSVIVNVPAPTGTGSEGAFVMQRGGSQIASLGLLTGSSDVCLWLDTGSPNSTNFTLLQNVSGGMLNAQSGLQLFFGIGGSSFMNMTSGALFPQTAGGLANGNASLYWNGVYSSSFQFPATLGSAGYLEWSGVSANLTGNDTYVEAQTSSGATGTNTGGTLWLMAGDINGGTGLDGQIVAAFDGNTAHRWVPTGVYSTFQVIDRAGLNLVVGNWAAVSGGSASYSAVWVGGGSGAYTPSATNYSLAQGGSTLYVNGSTALVLQVAGTTVAGVTSSLFGFDIPIGGNGSGVALQLASATWTISSGVSNNIGGANAQCPIQIIQGSISGAGTYVKLPSYRTVWILDFTGVTGLGTNYVTVEVGSPIKTFNVSSAVTYWVYSDGASKVYFTQLS